MGTASLDKAGRIGGVGFRLLGEVCVVADGAGRVDLGTPKQRVVFAALVLAAGYPMSVDALTLAVWGEHPPANCRNVLATYVSRLRQVLARVPGTPRIANQARGYVLACDPATVDVFRFRAAIAHARQALDDGDDELVVGRLSEALAQWSGEALAGLPGDWSVQTAVHLERERRDARAIRIDALLRAGRGADVLDELYRLVDSFPLDEQFATQLMRALSAVGRGADALATYHTLRDRLAAELGVEPSAPAQEAYLMVLRSNGPPEVPVARLAPAQLPAAAVEFTGREPHLADLDRLLDVGGTMVISAIAGSAGVGKTSLAVHWGHRVRDRFPDGQLYLNLRGYAAAPPVRPIEALAAFLRGLGVPPERVPFDEDEAAALYRTILDGRRLLVVLDNAYHADQVRPLLPGGRGSVVLVTSRDSLTGLVARDGARALAVDVLTPAEARMLLRRLLGSVDAAALDALAEACAYLPLALRIAAAHLAGRSETAIADYVAELVTGDRLGALEVAGDPKAAVRGALELSYLKLAPAAQGMFRLLGVLPGPDVTAEAAGVLTGMGTPQAKGLLAELACAHLIDEHAPGRYAQHDLLRAYARELVAPDPAREAATDRLAAYYQSAVDAAAPLLYPQILRLPADPPTAADQPVVRFATPDDATAWLDAERTNLVAAVQHAAAYGHHRVAWRLADALRGYLYLRTHTADWLAVADAALRAATAEDRPDAVAAAHLSLATLRTRQGQHEQAINHFTQAKTHADRADWLEGAGAAAGNLGNVFAQLGQLDDAARCLADALALNRRTGWLEGQAANLFNLGLVAWQRGRLDAAADHLHGALALAEELGSCSGQANILTNLGETVHALGRLQDAESMLNQALAIQHQSGAEADEAEAMRCLAAVQFDAGNSALALTTAQRACELAGKTGNDLLGAATLATLAGIERATGRPADAIRRYEQSRKLSGSIGTRYPDLDALIGLAAAHLDLRNVEAARQCASQAVDGCRQAGFSVLEAQARTVLASVLAEQGATDEATRCAQQAWAIHRECGHRLGAQRALAVLRKADGNREGNRADDGKTG